MGRVNPDAVVGDSKNRFPVFGVQIDLTNSRFLIYGIILVMTMLFRPEGLIPSRQRRSELRAGDGIALQEQELFTEATP